MNWWRVLKIDEFIRDPKHRGQAFFNPQSGNVTMNLAHPHWKEVAERGEDAFIDAIEEMITHEYAHKATSPEIQEKTQEAAQNMRVAFVEYILRGDDSQLAPFIQETTKFANFIAIDEAYAYLTAHVGSKSRREKGPRITTSAFMTGDQIVGQLHNTVMKIGSEMMRTIQRVMGQEEGDDYAEMVQERYRYLYEVFINEMAKVSSRISAKFISFVRKLNNLSDEEVAQLKARAKEEVNSHFNMRVNT